MGEMIPDLSREVVHLLESSAMYDAASVGALGATAMYGRARNNDTNDMGEDMKAAMQWLVDFLRGKHIAARGDEVFELPL
ncbi:hypothetical protein ZWY2020_019858 [Hordeum vulgare]|nr:hypothetical protein ZWY2020_019858 [Hordeum vulgare]